MARSGRSRIPRGPRNDRQAITTLVILTVSLLMWALWRVAPYRNVEPVVPDPSTDTEERGVIRLAPPDPPEPQNSDRPHP